MSDSKHSLVAVLCPLCKRGVSARRTSDEAWCRHCGHRWAWKKARLVRAAGRESA
jgi:DNA-directed RNA polymerase subunit RPC12/RpoP